MNLRLKNLGVYFISGQGKLRKEGGGDVSYILRIISQFRESRTVVSVTNCVAHRIFNANCFFDKFNDKVAKLSTACSFDFSWTYSVSGKLLHDKFCCTKWR